MSNAVFYSDALRLTIRLISAHIFYCSVYPTRLKDCEQKELTSGVNTYQ